MKIFFFLILTLALSACSLFEEDDITRLVPVDSIIVNGTSGLSSNFTALIPCGSICWKESYFKSSVSNKDIFIKTFAIINGSAVCPAVYIETEIPISIQLKVPGSYIFHFWKSDSTSIDTTLNIGI